MAGRGLSLDLQDINSRLGTREILPWTTEQLVGLIAANIVGLMLVGVGWWQTLSRDESASDQFGWFNLAVVGLIVAGCANVLWLARGRRTVTLAKTAVLPHAWIRGSRANGFGPAAGVWSSVPGLPAPAGPVLNGATRSTPPRTGAYLAAEGMSRYHRPDCILVAGKAAIAAAPADHVSGGRRPCEICQP